MKTQTVYPGEGYGNAAIYPRLYVKIQGRRAVKDFKKLISDVKSYNKSWQRVEKNGLNRRRGLPDIDDK